MSASSANPPDASLDEHLRVNRAYWDKLADVHARLDNYGIDVLRSGGITLRSVEREELGDLAGRTVLHVMCHIGLDTLSFARLGAIPAGVDFSPRAILHAQRLSAEMGLPARFVCTELHDLPALGPGTFDLVFASYGVLDWIPRVDEWVRVCARMLRPGGVFYLVDAHPLLQALEAAEYAAGGAAALTPYFFTNPRRFCETQGTYADRSAPVGINPNVRWNYSLGEIASAVAAADLEIRHLHEFPFTHYQKFDFMTRDDDGWWRCPSESPSLPLLFSLSAVRPPLNSHR